MKELWGGLWGSRGALVREEGEKGRKMMCRSVVRRNAQKIGGGVETQPLESSRTQFKLKARGNVLVGEVRPAAHGWVETEDIGWLAKTGWRLEKREEKSVVRGEEAANSATGRLGLEDVGDSQSGLGQEEQAVLNCERAG